MTIESKRLPSLDGLRAVSIIMVTVGHVFQHAPQAVTSPSVLQRIGAVVKYGGFGVDIFFVISGFLITHLLIQEHARTGRVNVVKFYVRRALRILPAYYFFLLTIAALVGLGYLSAQPSLFLECVLFIFNTRANYSGLPPIGQVWSLCVEEHFYLLWPATLVLCGLLGARITLFACFVGTPLLRYMLFVHFHSPVDIDFFSLTRFDTIAMGALLAFFHNSPTSERWSISARRHGDKLMLVCCLAICVSIFILSRSGLYTLLVKRGAEAFLVAAAIFIAIRSRHSLTFALLNCRPMVVIGTLSYALYLAQTFVVVRRVDGWPLPEAYGLPIALAYAILLHLLIERPFLRLKDRLYRRDTTEVAPPPSLVIAGKRTTQQTAEMVPPV